MFCSFFNQFEEPLYGMLLRDIFLYALFTAVKAYTAAAGAYVTEIGIGHLTGTVHYAAHSR